MFVWRVWVLCVNPFLMSVNWLQLLSELRVIELNWRTSLHHVFESTLFICVRTACCPEVCSWGRLVLRMGLRAKGRTSVIGLVLVRLSQLTARTASLWKGPPREVLFGWRVWWGLWHIAAGANRSWGRGLVLQTSPSSSITEGVLRLLNHFWPCLREVLRAWSGLKCI
jgi:hypothetical protein